MTLPEEKEIGGIRMNISSRFRNPWFWITIISLFLSSTQIDPKTLTSWPILIEKLEAVFSNPYLLFTFFFALLGQFMDPSTKGVFDNGFLEGVAKSILGKRNGPVEDLYDDPVNSMDQALGIRSRNYDSEKDYDML